MVTVAVCVTGGTVALKTDPTSHPLKPLAGVAPKKVKQPDKTLLKRLITPDYGRPDVIGKSDDLGQGFAWADHFDKRIGRSKADLDELFIDKADNDTRVVVLKPKQWVDLRFTESIAVGEGADIVMAGWGLLPLKVAVLDAQGKGFSLPAPTQLADSWGRDLLGYDLSGLPDDLQWVGVRIGGAHDQGHFQGAELHEVKARIPQKIKLAATTP